MNLVWIVIGGSLGALARYGTTLLCARLFGPSFPYGTLAVNLSGCFLIGLAMGLAERGSIVTPTVRLFFVTGFLGALTTFSTYAWESMASLRIAAFGAAFLNIALNNLAGFGLLMAGLLLTRL
jgi:fluoride exporter